MRKSTLYVLIALAAILIAGITAAVVTLYSDSGKRKVAVDAGEFLDHHELISAVPSDAAIVLCVKNFGRALDYLSDTVAVFRELTSRKFDKIAQESFDGLKKDPAIISIHYSKDMPPLLVVKTGQAVSDTTWNDAAKLKAVADSAGLSVKVLNGNLLIISSSETIANSSVRHLLEGHSVIESSGFAELAGQVAGSDILFVSNTYSDTIFETFLARKYRKLSGFFKEIAGWTAFTTTRHSDSGVSMDGTLLYGGDPAFYMNVLRHAGTSQVSIADAVPSNTAFILDLPLGNITSYLKAYRNYLDAKAKLDKYEALLSKQKKDAGQSSEDWVKSLDIKEVAMVNLHFDGKMRQMLFLRPGGKRQDSGIEDFTRFAGFAKTVFGEVFNAEDESVSATVNGWIVIGSRDCVDEFSQMSFETLKERLSACGMSDKIPQKGCGFWMYHSMTEDPNLISTTFSPLMAEGFRNVTGGVSYVPVTLSALSKGEKMGLAFDLTRTEIPGGRAPLPSVRDTTVTVNNGEFKVFNSATGKTNTLYQNSHLSICLKDENGKDMWGIPFKHPFCGYVKEIDYYNNGKLQYLFAADTKLYLIDRLGRFVGGFPVDLGKKIALGPEVYDFTGAKGYTAMVLHKDNTVGMYNLHGVPSPSWKGITSEETIKTLPELLEAGGKRYWIVRTSRQAFLCPFDGGEPVIKGEGEKMIRPDSEITFNEKGSFTAKCRDGKERTFKLEKEKR